MKTYLRILTPVAMAALIAGCATANYKKAGATSTSLRDAAQSIDHTLVPLDGVGIALSDLVNHPGTDLTPQFRTFSSALGSLTAQADILKANAATMREQGDAYLQNWNVELATIQNDDIQARSQERKDIVSQRFKKVMANYVETTADFAPFLADLNDIHTALATDLTVGGLASVKGLEKKINASASPLRESLVGLSAEFKRLGVSLAASSPGPQTK